MPIGYPSWSHDGQYTLYFDTTLTDDPAFFRVRISDRKLERLVSLKGMRRFWGQFASWTGLAPDDSLLLVRDKRVARRFMPSIGRRLNISFDYALLIFRLQATLRDGDEARVSREPTTVAKSRLHSLTWL